MNNELEELYDKIDDVVYDAMDNSLPTSKYYREKILSLIEEHTAIKAVKFAEWINNGSYRWQYDGSWKYNNDNYLCASTEELYKIYTDETGK